MTELRGRARGGTPVRGRLDEGMVVYRGSESVLSACVPTGRPTLSTRAEHESQSIRARARARAQVRERKCESMRKAHTPSTAASTCPCIHVPSGSCTPSTPSTAPSARALLSAACATCTGVRVPYSSSHGASQCRFRVAAVARGLRRQVERSRHPAPSALVL